MTTGAAIGLNDPGAIARSGAGIIVLLVMAMTVGLVVPLFMWFAVGAAAGYSLSGSV